MKNHWRTLFSFLPEKIERKFYKKYFEKEHHNLSKNNPTGFASNLTKHQVLKQIKNEYSVNTLVETGTYLGDTLYALYDEFNDLYSIELSSHFYNKAKKRFKSYAKIHLIEGDSGTELHKLIPKLKAPALFWLDGHYSGGLTAKGDKECPIFEELNAIFVSPILHLIVIDDARIFTGQGDYPTIKELKQFVFGKKPAGYSITVEQDSIRILPIK